MKSYSLRLRVLLFGYLAHCLLLGTIAVAQEPGRDLDDLAKRMSKELTKAKIGSVVVADLVNRGGTVSSEGHYLAEELSQRLECHKKNFVVSDPRQLFSALSNAKLSAKDLTEREGLQRIGTYIRADAIVTGSLEASPARYTVKVTVRRVKDGSLVVSGEQSVKRPAYVDSLVFLDPGGSATRVAKAGEDGIGVPICVVCPSPDYTGKARATKIQGNVVLLVAIDQEGRAGSIAVTKATDEGLAARAIEAVRKWKFKPATDKDGKAVAVVVPIEVSFRLY